VVGDVREVLEHLLARAVDDHFGADGVHAAGFYPQAPLRPLRRAE
jgi:hypothetical protein